MGSNTLPMENLIKIVLALGLSLGGVATSSQLDKKPVKAEVIETPAPSQTSEPTVEPTPERTPVPTPVPTPVVTPVPTVVPKPVVKAPVVSGSEAEAKMFIYMKESGNVACKINGGAVDCNYNGNRACGIGQALPCQKLIGGRDSTGKVWPKQCNLSDYACQDAWFTNYAMRRYGSWQNAKAFWLQNKWW